MKISDPVKIHSISYLLFLLLFVYVCIFVCLFVLQIIAIIFTPKNDTYGQCPQKPGTSLREYIK